MQAPNKGSRKRVCLVMIVKDEGAVIRRCLNSIKPYLDFWLICDTGSSDGTPDIVREELKGIPGELHQTPWIDFAHNRNEALQLARGKGDYLLLLDADMTVNVQADFRDQLEADSYLVRFEGPLDYYYPYLIQSRHDWKYVGVTHERLCADTARTQEKCRFLSITHHCDGHSRSEKYQRDIKLLTEGLAAEPDNARYMFYLAQSYRELGLGGQAFEWYAKRAEQGGWEEEVWHSLYQMARIKHQSALRWPDVLDAYLMAYQYRPSRLEPLLPVARHYREQGHYHLGLLFSRVVTEVPYPDDILFIERSCYEWELPLEYAICCYWLGLHEEAIRVNDLILANPRTPANFRDTAERNRKFSEAALMEGQRGTLESREVRQDAHPSPLVVEMGGEASLPSRALRISAK
jgi:glycosyltransferase involved in cell wall biosynthesis